jgi:photosystem II stability/assembly factor-like uncharacterized protein
MLTNDINYMRNLNACKYFEKIVASFLLMIAVVISSCYFTEKKNKSGSSENTTTDNRSDTWKTVGFGGGGATFYPEISPFNSDYAFVSCDMTGSYVTFNGGGSWRMFNLHSPVDFYVFDPLDSNTVYANSLALFKSTDKGVTWNLLYPSPSQTLGLVSKGDHAEEMVVTRDSTIREVQALSVDPENSKKLYAVISIDKAIALYVSDDGGATWAKEKDLRERAKNIFINPFSSKNNRTVYVTGNSGVMVRSNGQWKIHSTPQGVKMLTHFSAGYDKKSSKFIIYAISGKSYFNPEGDVSGIYYSDDGGASWQNRQEGLTVFNMRGTDMPEWRTIATSLTHPEVVYVSYNNIKPNKDTAFIGVAKSEDFGKTWTLPWKDIIKKGGNIPSANFDGGWINDRFGPTWGENPFSIGVSPVNLDICYATDFGRTVKTSNGGKTWQQVYTKKKPGGEWTSRGLEVTTGYQILWDFFDKNHVFMSNTDIGLMKSKDGGVSWESATKNNGVPDKWINTTYWLALDPEVKGRAWAAMSGTHDLPRPKMFRKNGVKGYQGGVVVTNDGGKSWKATSADIGEAAITHVLIDPSSNKEARTLYACAFGKGVYKSIDGGKTWKHKNNGIAGNEPFAWRIIRRDKDHALFLIINRRSEDGSIGNSGDGALYRSDDEAETWKPVALPPETNAPMDLVIDEENSDRLLLSAWGRSTKGKFSPDIGGGIFLSKDDGRSWVQVLQKDQHIHDITYDPRNKTYYACGFNSSAYRSGNKGETWSRIKGYNFKWGKRVDIDPSDPEKIFIITFGGGVWHGPANGDENSVEDILTPALAY